MTLVKNLKETAQKEIRDAVDITKLAAENIKQEVKQEINKQKIENKVEHMQAAYAEMKQDVKEEIEKSFH